MPKSSANKNNSVLLKQILGGENAVPSSTTSRGNGSTSGEQGTPPALLAHYRLITTPQNGNIPVTSYGNVPVNTNDVQAASAAVTSQTPFSYTAPEFFFVRCEVQIEVVNSANLDRWVFALRVTRNGYTADAAHTFAKAKVSAGVWQMMLNERLYLETGDVLQVVVRAFNTSNAVQVLTVNEANVKLFRA
jgi:hypothetical protein